MRKDQVDLVNATVWIPDSKTPNGVAGIPFDATGRGSLQKPDADLRNLTIPVP
jgi:hypothetical protein